MEQQPGFNASGVFLLVYQQLGHSLYGLKQSTCAWFGRFSNVLQQFGTTRCESNYSIFFLHSLSTTCLYLFIITGNDQACIHRLKQHSSMYF